jgi:hypothetical protein
MRPSSTFRSSENPRDLIMSSQGVPAFLFLRVALLAASGSPRFSSAAVLAVRSAPGAVSPPCGGASPSARSSRDAKR